MSLNLKQMRSLVREGLGGIDLQDLPDEKTDIYLNVSLWELEDKFPFKAKESIHETVLVVGKWSYDLTKATRLDAVNSVSFVDTYGKSHKLSRIGRDTFEEVFNDGTVTNPNGVPCSYYREKDSLIIWPPASSQEAGRPLVVSIKQSIESLMEADDTTGLPRNWDELVVMGAVSRGHFFGKSYTEARESRNFQAGIVRSTVATETKEEEDSRYAGLRVARSWSDLGKTQGHNPRLAP